MRKISYCIAIICLAAAIPLVSCEKEEEPLGDIELPPVSLMSENESWAVIEGSYLRLRERPESESRLVTTLFKGYVLEILSRSTSKMIMDGQEDFWYQVNYDGIQGWVFGLYLKVYDSREAAEIGARAVRAD